MGMLVNEYQRRVLRPRIPTTATELVPSDIYGMGSALTWNFCPGGPVEVVRIGVISQVVTFMQTATSLFEVIGDLHLRTSATGYTVTTSALILRSTSSAETGQPGNGIFINVSASPISMQAGDKMTFECTAANCATAGASGTFWIEYRDMPWQGVGRPTTAPGDGSGAGDIVNQTNVTL